MTQAGPFDPEPVVRSSPATDPATVLEAPPPSDDGLFAPQPTTARPSRRWRIVLIGVAVLLGLLGSGCVAALAYFDLYVIPSPAMAPSFEEGDRVLARGIGGDEVSRGDVVILVSPEMPGQSATTVIKRVVAVAGDEIGARDNQVVVDGEPLDEPYLEAGVETLDLGQPQVVPEGHIFVMGDNRSNSLDSRVWGPVPDDDVVALVVARFG